MNSDLISREALKKHKVYSEERHEYVVPVYNIDNALTVCNDNYSMGYQDGVRKVLSERPQGEWEKPFLHSDGRWYHKCTNCHVCSEVSVLQDKYCNYCPNCGADMREGRK